MNHWGSAEASSFCVSPILLILGFVLSGFSSTSGDRALLKKWAH
jgi:hypothetical protein